MVDYRALLKKTGVFKSAEGDKANGRLSHAYLLLCSDGVCLPEYARVFAQLILCEEDDFPCGICRACRLTAKKTYADAVFYPIEGDAVTVDDITALISESYIKPVEGEKKAFIINGAESMTAPAQNKLLKTLEEPPEGVYIILAATSEYPLLSTVKSRVKKIVIPEFSDAVIKDALKIECPDGEKLDSAIISGDGTIGRVLSLYGDDDLKEITDICARVVTEMKSSKDVLYFSGLINGTKKDFSDFLTVFESIFGDMLLAASGRKNLARDKKTLSKTENAQGYNLGAIIYALDKIKEAKERKNFNANAVMLTDWFLFALLEGKYKWRKS